jgi:hypothetical protein
MGSVLTSSTRTGRGESRLGSTSQAGKSPDESLDQRRLWLQVQHHSNVFDPRFDAPLSDTTSESGVGNCSFWTGEYGTGETPGF